MREQLTLMVPFLEREQWRSLAEAFNGTPDFLGSFDEWCEEADRLASHFERQGISVTRFSLDPERYIRWAEKSGRLGDLASMMLFGLTERQA